MAKKKKKNVVLGLDLGTSSIKAVEMTRDGEHLSVTGCVYEEVEDPANEIILDQAVDGRTSVALYARDIAEQSR